MSDSAVLDRLTFLEEHLEVPEFVGVRFIAKRMGVDEAYLRRRKYLLPGWGASDVPGKQSWRLKTVRAWLDEMTPVERERVWHNFPAATKKALQEKWGGRS